MQEHPFAPFIRILGKGPRLSRSLTYDEALAAARMILDGNVLPEQLGAFFCLLRVRTETPQEVAGLAAAMREQLPPLTAAVDLDWPSYAGKARRAPFFILSALLLARAGIRIALHGADGHTAGRLYTREALAAFGIEPAMNGEQAAQALRRQNLAFLPLGVLHPRLETLMDLKWILGLRSPLHTALRHLNPFGARASLISVFHPNYRSVHVEAARLLGQECLACFKGDGGEVERRTEKPCEVFDIHGNKEEWPALISSAREEEEPSPAALLALWEGRSLHQGAQTAIVGTAAIALKLLGRSDTIEGAETLAGDLWRNRDQRLTSIRTATNSPTR